jgi:hypothetical protein
MGHGRRWQLSACRATSLPATPTNGVYKSTNGGTSWSLLSAGPKGIAAGRIAIAVSKANSHVVYVTASGTGQTGSMPFGTLYKIMRSDNGGSTFTDLTPGTPNYMGGQGWYDTYVIADPKNAAIVYVTGSAGANSILRSTNSGVTWSNISSGGSSPHADHHAAVFDATGKLLDGDDGGIYRLDNPTAPSWTDLNGNLETIQFQGIGLHPTDRNKAIGGSQDNGTEVFAGSRVWRRRTAATAVLQSLARPTAAWLTIRFRSPVLAQTSSGSPPTGASPGPPGPPASWRIQITKSFMRPSS